MAALSQEPTVSIEQEAGWTLEPFWSQISNSQTAGSRALAHCCTAALVLVISIRTPRCCCNMQAMSSVVIVVRTCPLIPTPGVPRYLARYGSGDQSPLVGLSAESSSFVSESSLSTGLIMFRKSHTVHVSVDKFVYSIRSQTVLNLRLLRVSKSAILFHAI